LVRRRAWPGQAGTMACLTSCLDGMKRASWMNENTAITNTEFRTNSLRGQRPCVLRCAAVSLRGNYPEKPAGYENQDAYTIEEGGDGVLTGVFDGHGEYGDDCAAFVRENIGETLSAECEAQGESSVDWGSVLTKTFQRLNKKMHKDSDFDDELSGTTAVVAYYGEGAIWLAQVGDSRAVLGTVEDDVLSSRALLQDQTPFRKDERARVREAGAEVMSFGQRMKNQSEPDDVYWEKREDAMDADAQAGAFKLVGGEPRVWAPDEEKPGCAFTRSLGDAYGERFGVIAEPEILRYELSEGDRFVFMCSDGVHDFLTNQTVCSLIEESGALAPDAPPDAPLAACRAVVAEAYRLWLTHDVRSDDITITLVLIDPATDE